MIASLPMYDHPSTKAANDRFWQSIRKGLGFGPDRLDREEDPLLRSDRPVMLLSQTCGLPFRSGLHGRVRLVGTPDYGVEGCPPGYYCSCILVARDETRTTLAEFATARLARNDIRSQSGWAALVAEYAQDTPDRPFAGPVIDTGSHAASARAVAEERADFASVDAVTWTLLQRDRDLSARLRVLARTRPTPGLPFITGLTGDINRLRQAVHDAIHDLSREDREALMIRGLIAIPAADYLRIPLP